MSKQHIEKKNRFHLEFQTVLNRGMVIRMVEVQKMVEMVAGEVKLLYVHEAIPGEDLHQILVVLESIFERLNLK